MTGAEVSLNDCPPGSMAAKSCELRHTIFQGTLITFAALNKVAANIAIGRNHAGVHWYTDYSESLRLGEEIAIGILEEQALTYREVGSFTSTRFDGTQVVI